MVAAGSLAAVGSLGATNEHVNFYIKQQKHLLE